MVLVPICGKCDFLLELAFINDNPHDWALIPLFCDLKAITEFEILVSVTKQEQDITFSTKCAIVQLLMDIFGIKFLSTSVNVWFIELCGVSCSMMRAVLMVMGNEYKNNRYP